MQVNEPHCLRLAAEEAAKRWNLDFDRPRPVVRSEFLRRIAQKNFEHDSSLTADFRLLDDRLDLTPEGKRLAAVEERREISRLHSAIPERVNDYLEAASTFDAKFESPLSRTWYAEVQSMFGEKSNEALGIALEYYASPALRRPRDAAIKEIREYPGSFPIQEVEILPTDPNAQEFEEEFSPARIWKGCKATILAMMALLLLVSAFAHAANWLSSAPKRNRIKELQEYRKSKSEAERTLQGGR
jgi:hypothetical protein